MVETIRQALDAAGTPPASSRITKSALGRLRVDALRQLAEQLGTDSRGTKVAVAERLLQLASSEQGAAQAEAVQAAAAAQLPPGQQEG